MIIAAPYTANDVISFKLTSGEEMIARYNSEDENVFKVVHPVNLVPTPNGTFGMVPALFSAELNTSSISLQKSSIILHAKSKKDVADQYIKATTGIVTAPSANPKGGFTLK